MLDFRIDTFLEVCRLMNYTRAAAHPLAGGAVRGQAVPLRKQTAEPDRCRADAAQRRYHHEAGSDVFVQKDAGSRQRGR